MVGLYLSPNILDPWFISVAPRAHLITPIGASNHNIQSNKIHCIVSRHSILQYLVDQSYMFRSLMGSSSGIRIKVILHKTELPIHIHIKNIQKVNQLRCRRLLCNGSWYTVFWRRKDRAVQYNSYCSTSLTADDPQAVLLLGLPF